MEFVSLYGFCISKKQIQACDLKIILIKQQCLERDISIDNIPDQYVLTDQIVYDAFLCEIFSVGSGTFYLDKIYSFFVCHLDDISKDSSIFVDYILFLNTTVPRLK